MIPNTPPAPPGTAYCSSCHHHPHRENQPRNYFFQRPASGALELYDISNNNITNTVAMGQVGTEWAVSGFGDFSSKPGETDMLMRGSNTGQFEVYDISNNTITFSSGMGQVGLEWQVAGFGDFSGHAGETGDMLMRDAHRAIRSLRHQQQQITLCRPDGSGRTGMDGGRLRRFLRQCQRNRHADARQQYRRDSNFTTSAATGSTTPHPWARWDWSGRLRASVRSWRRRERHADARQQ